MQRTAGAGISFARKNIMSIKANPTVVGGFVIGAIILIVISLLVLGSGRFFKNDLRLMAVFPGSVKGLNVGAPVLFRGVNIGSVAKIKIHHDPETRQSLVPVYIDLKQEVIELINPESDNKLTEQQALAFMVAMVKSGLHARLTLESFVSGRQMVEFEVDTSIPIRLTGIDKNHLEIPTVESDFEKIQNLIKSIPMKELTENLVVTFRELNKIFIDGESRSVLENLNETITGSRAFIDNLNQKIVPLADSSQDRLEEIRLLLLTSEKQISETLLKLTALSNNMDRELQQLSSTATNTFKQTDKAFANINTMVNQESVTRHSLEESLKELSKAAKSMRAFTEYLERHPDAIIRGKGY
jgi:paraquat-inducible protein B